MARMFASRDIGLFTVLGESAVAAYKRIEALTSEGARRYLEGQAEAARRRRCLKTSPAELPARIAALADERRRLERDCRGEESARRPDQPKSGGEASREIAG